MWALFLAAVVAIELARRLPLLAAFRRLAQSAARAGRVVRSAGSDRWKERAMRSVSARLLAASARAGLLLLAVAAPFLLALAADAFLELGIAGQLLDGSTRLVLAAMCLGYAIVRFQLPRLRPR